MLQILQPECMMGDLSYGAHSYTSSYPVPPTDAYDRSDIVPSQEMSYGMHMSTYGGAGPAGQMMPLTVPSSRPPIRHRHFPPLAGASFLDGRNGFAQGPVRRRISRACDQCNQLRTKCDGKLPCAHCVDFSLKCAYNRERKKRGKASRKDIARQKAAAAAASGDDAGASDDDAKPDVKVEQKPLPSTVDLPGPPPPPPVKTKSHVRRLSAILPSPAPQVSAAQSALSAQAMVKPEHRHRQPTHGSSMQQHALQNSPQYKGESGLHVSPSYHGLAHAYHDSMQSGVGILTSTPPYPHEGSDHMPYTSPAEPQMIFQPPHMHSPSYVHESGDNSFHEQTHSFYPGHSPPFGHMQRQTSYHEQHPQELINFSAAPDVSPYQSPSYIGTSGLHSHPHPHAHQLPTPQPQMAGSDEAGAPDSMPSQYDMHVFSRLQHSASSSLLPNSSGSHAAPMRRATIAHIQAPSYEQFSLLSPTSQHEPPASAGMQVTSTDESSLHTLLHSSLDDQQSWLALPSPPPTSYPPDSFSWTSG